MGLYSGANPNAVQTALDGVVDSVMERQVGPSHAHHSDAMLFNQTTADRAAVIHEVFKGSSLFGQRAEQQDVAEETVRIGDQITFNMETYSKALPIAKRFFDDDQWDVVNKAVRDMAMKAKITMDDNAMSVFRDGFSTVLTADGAAFFSNSHTNLNGDTVDNLDTAALSETSLNTGITALIEQLDQAGVAVGYEASCLLVPPALFKLAGEILDSEYRSGTADNDINMYSSKYGITLKQSNRLGAVNSGGSDTAWFLLSNYHNVYRWTRTPLTTDLVDYKFQSDNSYIYKMEFREEAAPVTYEGAWASNGTV